MVAASTTSQWRGERGGGASGSSVLRGSNRARSEEGRGGEKGRSRGGPDHLKKKKKIRVRGVSTKIINKDEVEGRFSVMEIRHMIIAGDVFYDCLICISIIVIFGRCTIALGLR